MMKKKFQRIIAMMVAAIMSIQVPNAVYADPLIGAAELREEEACYDDEEDTTDIIDLDLNDDGSEPDEVMYSCYDSVNMISFKPEYARKADNAGTNDIYDKDASGDKTYLTVHFNVYNSPTVIQDQYVPYGGKVTRPEDPVQEGYTFLDWFRDENHETAWDFENDVVTENITLYAYFWADSKSESSIYIGSSTRMHGDYVDTVIGRGCTEKLWLTNEDGGKLKVSPNAVTWTMSPYYADGTKPEDYFSLKKGVLKCKNNAPYGYKMRVKASYRGSEAFYCVTIIPKVSKVGYYNENGKFKSKLVINVKYNSKCYFGDGPHSGLPSGTYVGLYDEKNIRIGNLLYEQPNGRYWVRHNYPPEGDRYLGSAILSKRIKVKVEDRYNYNGGNYLPMYYFLATKGKYVVKYLSPDGSGKTFTMIYKAKRWLR